MRIGDEFEIKQLRIGQGQPALGLKFTAYYKDQVHSPLHLSITGFSGDEHSKGHGGIERAVNHYSESSYQILRKLYPQHSESLTVGGFAENIYTEEETLSERNVCIGDIFEVGQTAIVQVSQPRKPCPKVNKFHDSTHLTAYSLKHGISGWFYRVLKEGDIKAGDRMKLIDRKHPNHTIERIQIATFGTNDAILELFSSLADHKEFLQSMLDLPELSDHPWKKRAAELLQSTAE